MHALSLSSSSCIYPLQTVRFLPDTFATLFLYSPVTHYISFLFSSPHSGVKVLSVLGGVLVWFSSLLTFPRLPRSRIASPPTLVLLSPTCVLLYSPGLLKSVTWE
uniref:Uncharacterized protein n=1 Tax=Trypanosoma vivax (strain Y486) TaxID=1055687 RepID=G0U2H9_TRYVY|nr:hypothetical protein TVY486_0903030 [Trypanosoma vivax Y486]